jgi:hydroxymethylbilane synthase
MSAKTLSIGTRGSPLALAQAHEVRDLLLVQAAQMNEELSIEIKVMKTTGDIIQDRPLSEVGGKGLFTKELDRALDSKDIDLAVHSMKDVATVLPEGTEIAALLEREDPRDVFISNRYGSLDEMPAGATIGTASLRRQAMILSKRSDLKVCLFRGNVQTRLGKLRDGVADATLLALAGLNRLGQPEIATQILGIVEMLPAVAQGAIGIQIRSDDELSARFVRPLNDPDTVMTVSAERALLRGLDGSCRTPIAGHAILDGGQLNLRAWVAMPDGTQAFSSMAVGEPETREEAEDIGETLARSMRTELGEDFFAQLETLI